MASHLACFNSILVQLDDAADYQTALQIVSFNSILVQLEAHKGLLRNPPNLRFNSILVQLEEADKRQFGLEDQVSIPYWCN